MNASIPISPRQLSLLVLIIAVSLIAMGSMRPSSDTIDPGSNTVAPQENDLSGEKVGKAEDLVKDWPKPDFVLFVTGRQHGYIEPCGCITLERQKGGLMRRHSVKKVLEKRGWPLVAIDAGNQIRRTGNQPEIKLMKTYEALSKEMKYDVIGLGPDDLKLPPIEVAQKMANNMPTINSHAPFTSANAQVLGQVDPFQIIVRNGKKIGVTTVLGDEHLAGVKQPGLDLKAVGASLGPVIARMNAANCDMKVLVAFTSLNNCRTLAKNFPVFDVLVTAGGAGDPTLHPEIIKAGGHTTSMIQVGVKGMYVGLVGVFATDPKKPLRYERVELDHRYKDSEEIKRVFKAYQAELKDRWIAGTLADIRPREHPSGHSFVGSDACADCHGDEFDIWKDGPDGDWGPHAEATEDLEENPNDNRVWVQRDYDPECMSCHGTGWNPQNFFPYKTGLIDPANADKLTGNGCENCHGPGSAHVDIQKKKDSGVAVDEKLRKKLADEMVLTLEEARAGACKECHDLDNSPDFLKEGGFDEYWPHIEHGGDE